MGGSPVRWELGVMTLLPARVRVPAVAAPVLLFLYGVLRLVDGLDGAHGPGLAWNLGHSLFFAGLVSFGVLIVGLRRLVPDRPPWVRRVADVSVAAGLFGVGCFLWVTLCDLFPELDETAPLPAPLKIVGPLAFPLGLVALLVIPATMRPRRLRADGPLLVLAGFAIFTADLDLFPVGALFLLAGLAPLARPALFNRRSTPGDATVSRTSGEPRSGDRTPRP
ncbi:hypothetical protein ACIBVL_38565 [Streptomyces sp. NPDC049687]|uniref:hypothetical protein n=1 Tax=Streptomyces sp. NPDC049687 TaxID=3365596 RepID=UPI003796DDF1